MNRGGPDPSRLPPRETVRRFLNAKRPERTDASMTSYEYRLKLWVEWCQAAGIQEVGELTGWDFDEYKNERAGEGVSPSTLNNEFDTLHQLVKYLASIDAVGPELVEQVAEMIPEVPPGEATSDVMLDPADAVAQLRHYRQSPQRGTLNHAWLEVMWHTGARIGGLRALDLQDYYPDEHYVEFVHRPNAGTPLKKKLDGERPVGLPEEVCRILDHYIDHYRWDKRDSHDRQPLFTSTRGRPASTGSAMRNWTYMATFPCIRTECPHGKDPDACEFTSHPKSSQCPSSRSPHQVITGSITWQRDIGFPPEVVAERTNKSISTVKQYYDKASQRERLERRRRPYVDRMTLDALDTDSSHTDTNE